MVLILYSVLLLTTLYLLHKLGLWMEDKGWLYYRGRGRVGMGNKRKLNS